MKKRIKKVDDEVNVYNTLDEAIKDFLKFKTAQGMSELTMRDYVNTFDRFMKVSDNSMNVTILKTELLSFLTSLTSGSPAKFNRPYSNMNSLFNWLVQQKVLCENPLLELGLKKKRDEGRIRCVEVEDVKKLLQVIDLKSYVGLRDYTLILLMLDCGIRPCEAFRLEINDVDFKNMIMLVDKENAKTRTERVLPLSATTIDLLQRIIKLKPREWNNNFVFCTYEGLAMNTRVFDKRLLEYSKKARVKVTPYDLRHTFAILYLRNDGNPFTLQKTMGHSDLSMTKRYLGLSMNDLKEQHHKASPLQNIVKRNTRVTKLFR